jgi:hypothetical protein
MAVRTAAIPLTLRGAAALLGFADAAEADDPTVMLGFTLAGTIWPVLVKLTGAGATDGVKLLLRLGSKSTPWPPAPMTDWLAGAVNGTYAFALSGPGKIPVKLVCGR